MEYISNIASFLVSFGMVTVCILLGNKIRNSGVFGKVLVDYYKTVKLYSEHAAVISIKIIAPMFAVVYLTLVNFLMLAWIVIFTDYFDNLNKGVFIISWLIQVVYLYLAYLFRCDSLLMKNTNVSLETTRSKILTTMNELYKQKDLSGLILLMHDIKYDPKIGVFTKYVLLTLVKRLVKSVEQFNNHTQQGVE